MARARRVRIGVADQVKILGMGAGFSDLRRASCAQGLDHRRSRNSGLKSQEIGT
jgi:hypothetical protein